MEKSFYIVIINGRYDSIHTDYDSLNEYIENYYPSHVEIFQLPYNNCVELLADLIQNVNLSDLWRIYDFVY